MTPTWCSSQRSCTCIATSPTLSASVKFRNSRISLVRCKMPNNFQDSEPSSSEVSYLDTHQKHSSPADFLSAAELPQPQNSCSTSSHRPPGCVFFFFKKRAPALMPRQQLHKPPAAADDLVFRTLGSDVITTGKNPIARGGQMFLAPLKSSSQPNIARTRRRILLLSPLGTISKHMIDSHRINIGDL